jgi:hypothetical protein
MRGLLTSEEAWGRQHRLAFRAGLMLVILVGKFRLRRQSESRNSMQMYQRQGPMESAVVARRRRDKAGVNRSRLFSVMSVSDIVSILLSPGYFEPSALGGD